MDHKFLIVAKSVIRMAKWRCKSESHIAVSTTQILELFHSARVALGEGREKDGGLQESEQEFERQLVDCETRYAAAVERTEKADRLGNR